ncbi:hypothetical protein [Mycolicibacterium flavescens]|uniref:hypothetical protein n=1 Tax=Mycolicibacterium flavescens TaxID=1776 RepID=UPI001F2D7792|nr:hypothetical protein [Mycolicibacterium flavescens]
MGNRGILHDGNQRIVRQARNRAWLIYRSFVDALNRGEALSIASATELDRRLHASRRAPHAVAPIVDLPDGVFVRLGDDCCLKWAGALHRWTPEGYVDADAGIERATVLTPALSVGALRHGYRVDAHPSVRR